MSVYHGDNALFFREALESIFSQSRKPDEVVLVVDGPVTTEIDVVIEERIVHSVPESVGD